MASNASDGGVLVVGLGRFGTALAETLMDLGHQVLGVDADPGNVQRTADLLTHVVEADGTDEEVMRQLGAGEFGRAVVGIGTDLEASILTTSVLVDLEVPDIWAKAITVPHDMGRRVAHLVTGQMIEFVQLDEGFALVELKPPKQVVGRSLGDAQVRSRYGVTVVCIKPEGGSFTYATPGTVPGPNDILVVAGETDRTKRFADLG